MRILILVLLVVCTAGASSDDSAGVNWYGWSAEAFATAKSDNKLIMVYVGHEGCTACRFMEQNTFSDPRVVELLNTHFVPIQVDSVAEPDIGDRYSDWAWPANAVLLPDATQVLAFRGRTFPDRYVAVLTRLVRDFREGNLKADDKSPYGILAEPRKTPFTEIRDELRARQDRVFARMQYGIFENSERVRHLMLRSHVYGDQPALTSALRILDGVSNHIDPVWGGMFYESVGDWTRQLPEKRLENQYSALQAYSDAYQITGEPRYAKVIADVHRYLQAFMRTEQGTYYASTQDRLDSEPQSLTMYEYYELNDLERRKHGLPTLDRAVYTDQNGRIITGYAMAYVATGKSEYLTAAQTAADALLKERQTKSGWMIQLLDNVELQSDKRSLTYTASQKPFLKTQGHFGLGLLALYDVTGEKRYRDAAVEIAEGLRENLEDSKRGGFFGSIDDGTPGRRKPLEDNAAAARFLYILGTLEKNADYKLSAERAIQASASPEAVEREGVITGNLLFTLEVMTAGYVEFSVVGKFDDPRSQALIAAGRDVYEPRKLIHFEAPGRYPLLDRPAMYICNDNACSIPIFDPKDVPRQAAAFTQADN